MLEDKLRRENRAIVPMSLTLGGEERMLIWGPYQYLPAGRWQIRPDIEILDGQDPVTIRIRPRREMVRLLQDCGYTIERYAKRGFVQRYLPLVGQRLHPNGAVLNACGAVLGWYHLFECAATDRPAEPRGH